jgi:3'-phosphoadenosine 5'-phosphosulfate sulfotransferase (PAPS reductase)/FAD synthetase
MQRVFNFSGGRTSAYMVLHYYTCGDIVLFCDTGREHPDTYRFINDFEANEGIPITRLKYPGGFDGLLKAEKNKAIPNPVKRFCTKVLKIKTARRYLRSIGLFSYENFIGFRSDEQLRVIRYKEKWQQVRTRFPLYEDGISKAIILDYWKQKSYNLEIPSILGNCTLCFMKGKNAIVSILARYPELAEPWINDEKLDTENHTYFNGITIEQLRNIAQNSLFKQYDLEELQPAFNCACTS